MQEVKTKIESFLNKYFENTDLFIINLSVNNTYTKVQVTLDGDNGVKIENCAKVSRELGDFIEKNNLIESAYNLEVASAGADKPLVNKRQYKQHIGRKIKVLTESGDEYIGVLKNINEENIIVEKKEKKQTTQIEINFKEIKKSNIIISI